VSSVPAPGVFFPAGRAPSPSSSHRKAIFLDRDGVINVNHGYVHTMAETEWVPGVFDFCQAAANQGYALVVVTNQAGIARGYYSEAQFRDYMAWVHAQFEDRGVPLLATWYCPHHPTAGVGDLKIDCGCRKPKPGMIVAACEMLGINPGESLLVGDQPSDLEAAQAAGVGSSFMIDPAAAHPFDGLLGRFGKGERVDCLPKP